MLQYSRKLLLFLHFPEKNAQWFLPKEYPQHTAYTFPAVLGRAEKAALRSKRNTDFTFYTDCCFTQLLTHLPTVRDSQPSSQVKNEPFSTNSFCQFPIYQLII